MSQLLDPTPGLFFTSFLYRSDQFDEKSLEQLWRDKIQSECLSYHHSYFPMADYYSKEMGSKDLLKRFFNLSLAPKERGNMVSLKKWSTAQEDKLASRQSRMVNIDVGLLTLENVTLATGKNFVHRTFLGEGVFSDLTLMFERGSFVKLPWSYPDYSHPEVIEFFNWARSLLHQKILHRA